MALWRQQDFLRAHLRASVTGVWVSVGITGTAALPCDHPEHFMLDAAFYFEVRCGNSVEIDHRRMTLRRQLRDRPKDVTSSTAIHDVDFWCICGECSDALMNFHRPEES